MKPWRPLGAQADEAAMTKKEPRLAMAYCGGVSLAIYQHGIHREILNLVRASRLRHRGRHGEP